MLRSLKQQAEIAQLVEQRFCKPWVRGPSPRLGSILNMTELSNQEIKDRTLPKDELIKAPDGRFKGAGFVYLQTESGLKEDRVDFDILPEAPLPPFYYNKPVTNPNSPFEKPLEFKRDENPRSGYYPLALTFAALRPPMHLYEVDDALFAAVNERSEEEPNWNTRYFPKNCLDPETWNQALQLLHLQES